jgi:hypothetical protein
MSVRRPKVVFKAPHGENSKLRTQASWVIGCASLLFAPLVPGLALPERLWVLAIALLGFPMGFAVSWLGIGFQRINPLCPPSLLRFFCLFAFYFFGGFTLLGLASVPVAAMAPDLGLQVAAVSSFELAAGLAGLSFGLGAAGGAYHIYSAARSAA